MTPPVAQVCAGSGLSVSFSTTGTFDPSNTFTVQLSDSTGSFSNPTAIGSGNSSPISCVIPSALPSGTYRIRVVSSSPAATSNDEPITVISFAGLTCNANPNPATPGSTVTFTLGGTGLPNGPFSITWDPDDGSSSQTTSAAALPTTLTHTYANPGAYAVSFRVTHTGSGCFQDCSVPLIVSSSSSLPQVTYRGGYLQVQSASYAQVEVCDGLGRLLYRGAATGPIPLPETGVYLVRVSTREGTSITRVFVP